MTYEDRRKKAEIYRTLGYTITNHMQDKRKLYRLCNWFVNELAHINPKSIEHVAKLIFTQSERSQLNKTIPGIKI